MCNSIFLILTDTKITFHTTDLFSLPGIPVYLKFLPDVDRSVGFMETIEPGDKTAVRFTLVFNNDVINKNTAVRFTWFQNSFETFETTPGGSLKVQVLGFPDKIQRGLFGSEIIFADKGYVHLPRQKPP